MVAHQGIEAHAAADAARKAGSASRMLRGSDGRDRAYELKEYLATILEHARPDEADELLNQWLEWAARSGLTPFVKLARTIRKARAQGFNRSGRVGHAGASIPVEVSPCSRTPLPFQQLVIREFQD